MKYINWVYNLSKDLVVGYGLFVPHGSNTGVVSDFDFLTVMLLKIQVVWDVFEDCAVYI
jgi:hypothetical protein